LRRILGAKRKQHETGRNGIFKNIVICTENQTLLREGRGVMGMEK
jgi:hypothetical protein